MKQHLVFIPGWGFSRHIWDVQMDHFTSHDYSCTAVTLPGHDGMPDISSEHWTDALADQIDWSAHPTIIGWSLGGLLALNLFAQHPDDVHRIVMVASTPKFNMDKSWPVGVTPDVLKRFKSLSSQPGQCVRQIQRLAVMGGPDTEFDPKAAIPSRQALEQGLENLISLDHRTFIPALRKPVLLIHGAQDAVISVEHSRWMHRQLPQSRLVIIDKCGHIPFVTYKKEFNQELDTWLTTTPSDIS